MQWSESGGIRDDDPYHAWGYVRSRSPEDAWCPLVIEATPAEETPAALVEVLQRIKGKAVREGGNADASEPFFRISEYENLHIQHSIAALEKSPVGTLSLAADYARLILVYAREEQLFPIAENPDYWCAPDFRILFSGQPIIKPGDTGIFDRTQSRGDGKRKVSVCIIDDSFAFLNEAFVTRTQENGVEKRSSRFREIWFQASRREDTGIGLAAGARLSRNDIDKQLARLEGLTEQEIYQETFINELGQSFQAVDPASEAHQPLARALSHGTHVAATFLADYDAYTTAQGASGSGHGGTAPETLDLYGIVIPTAVTQDTSGVSLGSYLIAAVRQAMLWSDDDFDRNADVLVSDGPEPEPAPLFINFSYGFQAGPKDGSSKLNQVLQRLLDSRNALGRPTTLVVPMGNSYTDRLVAEATLNPSEPLELDWVIQPDDWTSSYLEIFARSANGDDQADIRLSCGLTKPQGQDWITGLLTLDGASVNTCLRRAEDAAPIAALAECEREKEEEGWQRHGFAAVAPTFSALRQEAEAPAGRWKLRVENRSDHAVLLRVLVQRDDTPGTYPGGARQSFLDHPMAWSYGDGSKLPLSGNFDQLDPTGPITHQHTASTLAYVASDHVVVAGAGRGFSGDGNSNPIDGPAPYAASGDPESTEDGPDYTALTDRSSYFDGVFSSGTYSGSARKMNGSSVAAPRVTAFLAAGAPDPGAGGDDGMKPAPKHPRDRSRTGRELPAP